MQIHFVIVLLVFIDLVLGNELQMQPDTTNTDFHEAKHSLMGPTGKEIEPIREGKQISYFAAYSQTTVTTVTMLTVGSIWTCLSVGPVATCVGRRKRRSIIKEMTSLFMEDYVSVLDGSNNSGVGAKSIEGTEKRAGKRLTVWSTISNTLTLTTTTALAGTTVTVSALCNTVGGSVLANTCILG